MTRVTQPRELGPGDRIAGFVLGPLLHEGGMSRLYGVTHPGYRLPLVAKVPRLGPGAPLAALAAIENEQRILERLHGPHVPRLMHAGELERTPCLVLEYVAGDAYARAVQEAPLPLERLRTLGIALCRAVHELHRQNVIHLDLNPGNVRARANGQAVLIDFGLAHHAAMPDMMDAAFGQDEGTAAYIAPEQVRHVRGDSRSDLYAIGVMLYLYATGAYPFGRPNLLSLTRRLYEPPVPPRRHVPDLPEWLQEIILRLLEVRPDDRYPTAREVAYLLAHPEAVVPTPRARRKRRPGLATRLKLRARSLYEAFDERPHQRPYERISAAPHVLLALDLAQTSEVLQQALRNAVRKFARGEPEVYVTCLNVVPAGVPPDETDSAGTRLVAMRHFAHPLGLRPDRVFFHLAYGDPATAIIEYARAHVIDYIIVGARGSSRLRRLLGSVSSRVVAEAPCTVITVRSRRERATAKRSRRKPAAAPRAHSRRRASVPH